MAAYDFSIRTKLALWAGIGVLLVAGMLAEQQYGERLAGRQRLAADNKQLAAVAALRAAHDVRSMQIEVSGNPAGDRPERSRPRAEPVRRSRSVRRRAYRSRTRYHRRSG